MPTFDFSVRDRHALKWHFLSITVRDRNEDKALDKIWTALRLDEVASKATTDPDSLDATKAPYEMSADDRDALIGFLDQPKMGGMSRLLREVDKMLDAHRYSGGAAST
jgi:hypothetical protein